MPESLSDADKRDYILGCSVLTHFMGLLSKEDEHAVSKAIDRAMIETNIICESGQVDQVYDDMKFNTISNDV